MSPSRLRVIGRTAGELFVTLGLVVLLFVVYELFVTDLEAADRQDDANTQLEEAWAQQEQESPDEDAKRPDRKAPKKKGTTRPVSQSEPREGVSFARLYIPSFGPDFRFTIQHGVTAGPLSIGPGHYPGTAMPGRSGNFAVAGHRIGRGAPFNDLDRLQPCDAVVIETADSFYVYRVLPMKEQTARWERIRQAKPKCANVMPLRDPSAPGGGPYGGTVGRRFVAPERGDAVAPIPYRQGEWLPKDERATLLTLTTCHPEFSATQRMIIHATLVRRLAKSNADYDQLLEQVRNA